MCTYHTYSLLQKLCTHIARTHYCKSYVHTLHTLYGKSRCAQNAHSHYFRIYVHIPHILIIAKVVYILQCYVHILHIVVIAQVMCTYRNTHCCKSYAYIPRILIVATVVMCTYSSWQKLCLHSADTLYGNNVTCTYCTHPLCKKLCLHNAHTHVKSHVHIQHTFFMSKVVYIPHMRMGD